jgi:predicted  nucleic acid-binding Zn-ribbon protein
VDVQVRGLRSRLDSARRYLNAQTRLLEELELQGNELRTRRMQVQATAGNLEGEVNGLDERLEKLRAELNSASTNKQYTAVLTELNTVKESRSEFEDRILEQMERSEEISGEIVENESQCTERRKVRTVAENELHSREQEVGARLAELEGERAEAASAVPGAALKIFDEMADCYDGEAMASIEEVSRRHREYACGACNMQMPFESVAALLGTGETLVRCTACGRILYLEEETRGALAKK